jgi:hypothetical protein
MDNQVALPCTSAFIRVIRVKKNLSDRIKKRERHFGTGPAEPDTRMDTVTACLFSRNRVLDFLRPAAAGGAVFQTTDGERPVDRGRMADCRGQRTDYKRHMTDLNYPMLDPLYSMPAKKIFNYLLDLAFLYIPSREPMIVTVILIPSIK